MSLPPHIAERIETEPNTGCWIWTASTTKSGYGQVFVNLPGGRRRWMTAHRAVYHYLCVDAKTSDDYLPKDLHIHHNNQQCVGRVCCNPDHMAIKDVYSHMQDHKLAEKAQGRGWWSPRALARSRIARMKRYKQGPWADKG